MTDRLLFPLTLLAALGSGVVGGVLFAFSAFVTKALARLPAPHGIAAMQSINVVVVNRWFMPPFLGTAAACLALILAALPRAREPDGILRLVGAALYLVGGIGVTGARNIPLNNALAALPADHPAGAALWTRYVPAWTAWNHVRTIGAIAAAAALTLSLVADGAGHSGDAPPTR